MIPFTILSARIERPTGVKEIGILELSPEYFTFRLLTKQAEEYIQKLSESGQQNCFVLSFFEFDKRTYHEVLLECGKDIIKAKIKAKANIEFCLPNNYDIYRKICIFVENEEYRKYVEKLNREYLRYIYLKLDGDDAVLSQKLVGYPAEKELIYSDNLDGQRDKWGKYTKNIENYQREKSEIKPGIKPGIKPEAKQEAKAGIKLGIELDNPQWYRAYLDYPLREFVEIYRKSSPDRIRPLLGKLPEYLYIGNAYCPHLFPNEKQLYQLLEKTLLEQRRPVLVFAPVEENNIIKIESKIAKLSKWTRDRNVKPELVVNDWGMMGIIQREYPGVFHLTLGCLLNKQRRDTRLHYINRIKESSAFGQGPLQTDFYPRYLREHFGISRVSIQGPEAVSQLPQKESGLSATIHIPFFQINTSGWCPLFAMMHRGDRGKQTAVDSCSCECLHNAFQYPDFLRMTGRYNSIFGYDDSALIELNAGNEMKTDIRIAVGSLHAPCV